MNATYYINYYLTKMAEHETARDACDEESPSHFFHDEMATHYYLEASKLTTK